MTIKDDHVREETKNIIIELVKQLKPGMDLSRVMIPVDFLEGQSLLERITIFCSTVFHLDPRNGWGELSSTGKMKRVVKWFLSSWHVRPNGVKKPYNPILGELHRCKYDFGDGLTFLWFSEQVSHHPPITAYYGKASDSSIVVEGWYYPKSKFLGNSAASEIKGEVRIDFPKYNETYMITWPTIYARGILLGKFSMEIGGNSTISCVQNKVNAKIKFKSKPMIGGEYHHISGKIKDHGKKIFNFHGKWTEKVYLFGPLQNQNCQKSLLLDVDETKILPKYIPSKEYLKPNESCNVWKRLTEAVKEKNLEKAQEAKYVVEQEQREMVQQRANENVKWQSKYFKKGPENFWTFIGQNTEEYQVLEKSKLSEMQCIPDPNMPWKVMSTKDISRRYDRV